MPLVKHREPAVLPRVVAPLLLEVSEGAVVTLDEEHAKPATRVHDGADDRAVRPQGATACARFTVVAMASECNARVSSPLVGGPSCGR